jgi:hypothetical protein
MIPRSFWWSVLLLSAIEAGLNAWVFVSYHEHWHPDVAVITVLTAAGALYKLHGTEKRR